MSEKKPLVGQYKVSFDIKLSAEDDISLADIAHAIAEGFESSTLLPKIANLSLDTLSRKSTLKPGNTVTFTKDTSVRASLYSDGTHYTVGEFTENSQMTKLGEISVNLTGTHQAVVNRVTKEGIELIEFNMGLEVPLQNQETNELEDTAVSIDSLVVSPEILEKVEK